MPVPSGIDVSSSALRLLSASPADAAHLRRGHTCAQLAAGFGVGTTTAYRYIAETVEVLGAHAPTLAEAMTTAVTSTRHQCPSGRALSRVDRAADDQRCAESSVSLTVAPPRRHHPQL